MTDEPQGGTFFAELKRRKVVRVAIAYLGASSIMLEVSDNLFEVLLLDAFQRPLVIAVATGLPIVLVLAWLFDLTRKGVELTPSIPGPIAPMADGPAVRFSRQLVVSGAIVVLAMTGVGWRYMPTDGVEFESNRIAVVPFTNDTGNPELDHVGTVVARELGRNLERLEGLVIDPDDQPGGPTMQDDETRPPSTQVGSRIHAVAERTRAALVVSGSYHRSGDELVLRAEVYDAERRERVFPGEPVRGDVDDPLTAMPELQQRLFGFIAGVGEDEAMIETVAGLQTSPPRYEAYQQYVLSLELIRTAWFARREQLMRADSAVALDSSFVGALTLSALLHGTFGDRERARTNLERLDAMRADLTPFERAGADRARAVTENDREGAYRASNTVVDLINTSMSRYMAGTAALAVNRPREARDHFLRYDRQRMSHPAIYQMLGRAYHRLGSHRAELRLTRQFHERHPLSLGVGFLRPPEMGALAAVGRGDEALERLSSFELENAGAATFMNSADEIEAHGDPETARIVRERLLEREESIPEDERGEGYLLDRARLLASLARHDEAREILEGLIDDDPESGAARIEAALIAAATGDRAYAEETIDWLADRLPPSQRGSRDQARIAAALGDAERAVRFLRQAEEVGQVDFHGLHVIPAYAPIRDHPAVQEYLKPRDEGGGLLGWLPRFLRPG